MGDGATTTWAASAPGPVARFTAELISKSIKAAIQVTGPAPAQSGACSEATLAAGKTQNISPKKRPTQSPESMPLQATSGAESEAKVAIARHRAAVSPVKAAVSPAAVEQQTELPSLFEMDRVTRANLKEMRQVRKCEPRHARPLTCVKFDAEEC
jgi:hypothetical protein